MCLFDVNRVNIRVNSMVIDPPAVIGIYANGTISDGLFRDRVDGTEDGSTLGYELTGRADQTETLPWINVNQLIVEFDGAVSSVDASDFSLLGRRV